jgi:hypothetical protein
MISDPADRRGLHKHRYGGSDGGIAEGGKSAFGIARSITYLIASFNAFYAFDENGESVSYID